MIDLFTLTQVVQSAAEAGVANYIKRTQPSSDRLKMREAYRWFKAMGVKPCVLDGFIKDGLVKTTRMGKGKNSPLVVSKSEIMAVLTAKKIGTLLN